MLCLPAWTWKRKQPIDQNVVPLWNKLDIFLEALKKVNEIDKKEEKLYEETTNLYEEKKEFSHLITLFLKIHQKKKNLCSKLLEIFYKINSEENTDKVNDLKKEVKILKKFIQAQRILFKRINIIQFIFTNFYFVTSIIMIKPIF